MACSVNKTVMTKSIEIRKRRFDKGKPHSPSDKSVSTYATILWKLAGFKKFNSQTQYSKWWRYDIQKVNASFEQHWKECRGTVRDDKGDFKCYTNRHSDNVSGYGIPDTLKKYSFKNSMKCWWDLGTCSAYISYTTAWFGRFWITNRFWPGKS